MGLSPDADRSPQCNNSHSVAHILRTLTAILDHPDTQGQGIDRIAWHCELGIVAPLPRLFPAVKGEQVMASAAVTGVDEVNCGQIHRRPVVVLQK